MWRAVHLAGKDARKITKPGPKKKRPATNKRTQNSGSRGEQAPQQISLKPIAKSVVSVRGFGLRFRCSGFGGSPPL